MTFFDNVSQKLGTDHKSEFDGFERYMREANNGDFDAADFIASEYGVAMAETLLPRFQFEKNAMGEECLAFYRALGVQKEMVHADSYFGRYALFTPTDRREGEKYPLVISCHGRSNPIEVDEFSMPYPQMAGKERFISAVPQDTTPENIKRIIFEIGSRCPIDPERVYMAGYSQGGQQVNSAMFRLPELLAAAAPCGCDVWRELDTLMDPFTEAEQAQALKYPVPMMQMVGEKESSNFAPLNDYVPPRPRPKSLDEQQKAKPFDPVRDESMDPSCAVNGVVRGKYSPAPPEGAEKHRWKVGRLNLRLASLGCEERDAARCIAFANTPEDELHHVLGFYGDEERIETYFGYKHYIADVYNGEGLPFFRYAVVENSFHWPPVMMAQLTWQFMRRFRRDARCGKVVEDPYMPSVRAL